MKNKKKALLAAFTDDINTIDHKTKIKYDKLSKEIDIMFKKLREKTYQYDQPSMTDAKEFIKELGKYLDKQCFKIQYWTSTTDRTFVYEPYESFESYYLE